MEETLDHLSARVTLAGILGAAAGSLRAVLKGHAVGTTAAKTALSCAVCATACLTTERLAYHGMHSFPNESNPTITRYFSHLVGGIFGGSLLGSIYVRKPIQGALYFVPLMMGVAYTEGLWQEYIRMMEEEDNKQHDREKVAQD